MKFKDFYGYEIHENGDMFNRFGRKLKQRVRNCGRREIKLSINKKRVNFTVTRLVYCAFNDLDIFDLDRNMCVTFLDDNKSNIHIDNLELVHRSSLIQGENHIAISKLSDKQVKEIIVKYNSTINNRPVNQYDNDKPYLSYRSLAKEYGVTHAMIRHIIVGSSRNKDNYVLKEVK